MEADTLLKYSMELSLLAQLLHSKLISEIEYQKIKVNLMKDYNVLSDLTATL